MLQCSSLCIDQAMTITLLVLAFILLALLISEWNSEIQHDLGVEYEDHSIGEIRSINRNNWNANTWRISLIIAIIAGILISIVLRIGNFFDLLMIILIVFIVTYFLTAWLSSHWHKNSHENIDRVLITM